MAGLVPFNKKGTNLFNRGFGFNDIYNMFDNFFDDRFFLASNFSANSFKLDVAQNEKEYLIEADLPGVKRDEVNIDMKDGRLSISVIREESKEDKTTFYIHKERAYSSMSRSVYIDDADEDNIKAKLENGILCILVPKSEKKVKKHKIEIE